MESTQTGVWKYCMYMYTVSQACSSPVARMDFIHMNHLAEGGHFTNMRYRLIVVDLTNRLIMFVSGLCYILGSAQ